jgi:hypothetical protein
MTVHDDDDEINDAMIGQAIEVLRRETEKVRNPPLRGSASPPTGAAAVAVSMWQLVSELEESGNAPTTVLGVLDLMAALIADPRIDLVNEFDTGLDMIEFAWVGEGDKRSQAEPREV